MSSVASPSREGLILGAMLVALHGRKQECILAARHHGFQDWSSHPDYAAVDEALKTVQSGQVHYTDNQDLLSLMAHTQQLLRVSYDEWDRLVRVRPLSERLAR